MSRQGGGDGGFLHANSLEEVLRALQAWQAALNSGDFSLASSLNISITSILAKMDADAKAAAKESNDSVSWTSEEFSARLNFLDV